MLSKPSVTYPFLLIREDGGEVFNTRLNRAMTIGFEGTYKRVMVRDAPKPQRSMRLHVLVAEAFHGPRPPGQCALHRDDNKMNNTAENIYWGTRLRNIQDRRINNPQFLADATRVAELHAQGKTQGAIAIELGVTLTTVQRALRRHHAGGPEV